MKNIINKFCGKLRAALLSAKSAAQRLAVRVHEVRTHPVANAKRVLAGNAGEGYIDTAVFS